MSTTNIDEQKMQQINSSDTIKEFMEKCNNNFSIISQFGGGPEGKQGVEGSQGVPTKPKVPIHVWIEGKEYDNETKITEDKYKINVVNEDLTDTKYQDGHLIMLKNGHVYILEEDEEFNLKPNYIIALQSYNPDDVIDEKSAYIHIAYANSPNGDVDFITNKELQETIGGVERKYKYMGIYSSNTDIPSEEPTTYTWVRTMDDTGEKGDTGERDDTGRVLTYLGSFKDGTLTGDEVLGLLNEYRCDYYIDKNDVTWMRTGTSEEATGYIEGYVDGKKYNDNNWRESEKVGFLQAGAISADMINVQSLASDSASIKSIKATEIIADKEIIADNIKTGTIYSKDGNSYFNLDNGDFVLENDNGTALKYENGTLTIGGYDNIGGENICPHEELTAIYHPNNYKDSVVTKILCKVENGKKYIGTLGELVSTIPSGASELLSETFIMLISNDDNINLSSAYHLRHYKWGEVMNINLTDYELSQADVLYLALVFCNLDKVVEGAQDEQDIDSRMNIILNQNFRTGYYDETREIDTMTARRIMIALHGSTDITGGLVMTNVLSLKDEDGNVTAGMSGLKDDGITLWSGGTYEEAVNAAKDDSYDTGNGAITTLFKKDGTGKIGIFKISDTQAVVSISKQGKIVIDASDDGGIYIKDNNGENNVIIKNNDISLNDIFPNDNLIEIITGEKTLIKEDYLYNPGTVYYGANLAKIKMLDGGVLKIKNIRVELNDPTIEQATVPYDYTITTKLTIGDDTASSTYVYLSKRPLKDLNGNILRWEDAKDDGHKFVQLNSDSIKEYALDRDINIGVTVSVSNNECSCIPSTIKASVDVCYVQKSQPCTVIGSNGICSFVDRNTLFGILNDNENNMQKAYLIGLPDSAAETGQLYKTFDGTIKVKI